MARKAQSAASTYFPGLNGLRFIAALLVLVSHVELMKGHHGLASLSENPAVYELGRIAVTFFFVLSGFLITYLLLVERQTTGTIAIGKFYTRRVLRIWPLYFLVVVLAFFVLPRLHFFDIPQYTLSMKTLPLYVFFLPQLALSIFSPVPYAEPLWSIGVEEQFYLLWPLLVAKTRRFVSIAMGIAMFCILAKQIPVWMGPRLQNLGFWNDFIDYFYFTRMECMVVGALAAVVIFQRRERLIRFLYHPMTQIAAYTISAYLILTTRNKPILHYSVHSVLFAVIIVNIATNKKSLLRLENRPLLFLGNTSYAIYMLHEIVINAVIGVQTRLTGTTYRDAGSNVILYAASILLTIALASAVYWYFERWFLRRKLEFAVVANAPQLSPA
ncbi:MAG TPA: acyltransferase [Thermoanaerobaculia bacterium]|nr:acyltransferase [Thermoanaerobaculia bacterium]